MSFWSWISTLFSKGKLPAPVTDAKRPLVLLVRGLGGSQLGDVEEAVSGWVPNAQIVALDSCFAGEKNAEKGGRALNAWLLKCKYSGLVCIGHSFGCHTICNALTPTMGGNVVMAMLLVALDPADSDGGEKKIVVPFTVVRCVVFRRADGGLQEKMGVEVRADMQGVPGAKTQLEIHVVDYSHNEIPHRQDIITRFLPLVVAATQ